MEKSVTNQADAAAATYSATARRFHWWTVLLIALQIPIGLFMARYSVATNFAPPTGQLYDTHKLLGLAILLLVVARLIYRLVRGTPADEPTLEPWQKIVSRITHRALYALLIIVPLLGWLAVSYFGPFVPHGIKMPALASPDDARATQVLFLHMLAAYALILLIGMHVGAALFHYVIRKDGVLARMWVRAGRLS
jgi:cytochrome b561